MLCGWRRCMEPQKLRGKRNERHTWKRTDGFAPQRHQTHFHATDAYPRAFIESLHCGSKKMQLNVHPSRPYLHDCRSRTAASATDQVPYDDYSGPAGWVSQSQERKHAAHAIRKCVAAPSWHCTCCHGMMSIMSNRRAGWCFQLVRIINEDNADVYVGIHKTSRNALSQNCSCPCLPGQSVPRPPRSTGLLVPQRCHGLARGLASQCRACPCD